MVLILFRLDAGTRCAQAGRAFGTSRMHTAHGRRAAARSARRALTARLLPPEGLHRRAPAPRDFMLWLQLRLCLRL